MAETKSVTRAPPHPWARTTGAIYLVYFLAAVFGQLLVERGLIVSGDAVSLAADLCYAAVTLLFYRLFAPVSSRLSLAAALLSLIGCALMILAVFHAVPYHLSPLLFFGPYCILLGYLIARSTFLPRIFGLLMTLDGVGWLLLASWPLAHRFSVGIDALGILAEAVLMLWLPSWSGSTCRAGRPRHRLRARAAAGNPVQTRRTESWWTGRYGLAARAAEGTRVRIAEKLKTRRPFFSFEFFPPRDDAAERTLFATIATLQPLDPGFVSITYGAGGSTRTRTVDLAKRMRNEIGLDVMAHVTCVGASAAEVRNLLRDLRGGGIENVMALRGDPPKGADGYQPAPDELAHASDLIALAKTEFGFCIGGAAYPEKHPEAVSFDADLAALSTKVRAGAEFLVTQLFFDNARYFEFVERARQWGITVPILPGIMPITNYDQIDRFTRMCGATIPPSLRAELELRRDDPQAVVDLGVAYMTLQVADLLARGAPGVHFYTLNRSPATRAVVSALLAARRAW